MVQEKKEEERLRVIPNVDELNIRIGRGTLSVDYQTSGKLNHIVFYPSGRRFRGHITKHNEKELEAYYQYMDRYLT